MPGSHVPIRTRTEWADEAGAVKTLDQNGTGPNLLLNHETQPEQRWAEEDQTDPAGRFSQIINDDVLTLRRAATANWGSFTTLFQLDSVGWLVPDDIPLGIGSTRDTALVNVSAGLAINTADTGNRALAGTPVTPVAPAANSLLIGNITASGDILIAVNKAGTSHMAFMADASTGDTLLGVPTGQSIDGYFAGTKILDIAANVLTYSAALASGTQQLLVANTSNTADASNAQIWVSVGGGTSTGDPALILEVLGVGQWYCAIDNNQTDGLFIGDGTNIGSSAYLKLQKVANNTTAFSVITPGRTTTGGANVSSSLSMEIDVRAITISDTTTTTALVAQLDVQQLTLTAAGVAPVDKATGIASIAPIKGGSATLDHTSAYRALSGGNGANVSGFFAEAQTGGTTGNYQILMVNGGTQPVALANHVGMATIDFAGGDARLYINAELGSSIILGNNAVRTGLAGTSTGSFVMSGATSGVVTLTVAATAGTWTMTLPTGVAAVGGYQLTDAAGDGATSWTAAASRREYKDVIGVLQPQDALDAILHTVPYRFHYKEGMGTGDTLTEYAGPMAEESPWAMHYQGGIVNPVNTLGYMIGGFQAVQSEIDGVKAQIAALEGRLKLLEGV